ncbi:hypothetical protein DFH06DRAFT_1132775 [Mycena polygramma]|nr:hypothetical protein DFH06DRAFT_1132775 [Mycena polygramma]
MPPVIGFLYQDGSQDIREDDGATKMYHKEIYPMLFSGGQLGIFVWFLGCSLNNPKRRYTDSTLCPRVRISFTQRGGCSPAEFSNRDSSPDLELSYDTTDVPTELWAIIANFASRQTLASLCSVSHRFSITFSALLYANTVDPPLTASQSALLVQTLSDEKTSSKPHPATMIRHLGLKDGVGSQSFKGESESLLTALKNLELSCVPTKGLCVLHWSLAAGVGKFPHLKELVVSCDGTNKNFDTKFVHICGLEVLGINANFSSSLGDGDAINRPDSDFSAFLGSHPNLVDLTLSARGTKLTEDSTFLPILRSFTGSFQDSVSICVRQRRLETLVITPIEDTEFCFWPVFTARKPLVTTKLCLLVVQSSGMPMKMRDELSPESFAQLAASFLNLMFLDVCIPKHMMEYCNDLSSLTKLQSLRLREYRTRRIGRPSWPVRLLFPTQTNALIAGDDGGLLLFCHMTFDEPICCPGQCPPVSMTGAKPSASEYRVT